MTLDPRKPSVNFWGQTYTFDICINFKGPLIYGSDRKRLLPGNMEGLASSRQAIVFKGRRRVHPRGICSLRIQEGRLSGYEQSSEPKALSSRYANTIVKLRQIRSREAVVKQ